MSALKGATFALLLLSLPSLGQNWQDCRQQKLRQLTLEQGIKEERYYYGYRSRSAMKKEVRRIDEWLWKECRRYSKKLRKLYQKRM